MRTGRSYQSFCSTASIVSTTNALAPHHIGVNLGAIPIFVDHPLVFAAALHSPCLQALAGKSRKNGLHVGRGEIARASVAIGLPNIPDHYWNATLETAGGPALARARVRRALLATRAARTGRNSSSAKGRGSRVVSPSTGGCGLAIPGSSSGVRGVASKLHPSASRTGSKTRCAVLGHFRQKAGTFSGNTR